MGVDVTAVNMVGIRFDENQDTVDYINKNALLDVPVSDEVLGYLGGCADYPLQYIWYTEYDDYGGVLGVCVYDSNPSTMVAEIQKAMINMQRIIPQEDWDKIKFHSWVQYS